MLRINGLHTSMDYYICSYIIMILFTFYIIFIVYTPFFQRKHYLYGEKEKKIMLIEYFGTTWALSIAVSCDWTNF